jgi:hypothetical protein
MYPSGAAKFHVSTDGGNTFTVVNNYAGEDMGVATGIFTDPFDENTAYALFSYANSPKILKTTDLGQTWTDISGFAGRNTSANGFPNVAVYSFLVLPYDQNLMWAGTEIGLVESTDGGQSWHMANNGFPNVAIWDMKIVDQQVVVGTHARGIWSVTIDAIEQQIVAPKIVRASYIPSGDIDLIINLRNNFDSVEVINANKVVSTSYEVMSGESTVPLVADNISGNTLSVIGYEDGQAYNSSSYTLPTNTYREIQQQYQTDFADINSDFFGNNFRIRQVAGFRNRALHTTHDYQTNSGYIYQLEYPIRIASSNAIFEYDEVAIVAEGDEVVVEASRDGVSWMPIVEPYNATESSNWQSLVTSGDDPTQADFEHRTINLLETFEAGEVVLFRFRLTSDESGRAYGWVIDNLNIQGQTPLGYQDDVSSNALALTAYPNPYKTGQATTIKFNLPKPSDVNVSIYSVEGKLVRKVELKNVSAGENKKSINLGELAEGMYLIKLQSNTGEKIFRINR